MLLLQPLPGRVSLPETQADQQRHRSAALTGCFWRLQRRSWGPDEEFAGIQPSVCVSVSCAVDVDCFSASERKRSRAEAPVAAAEQRRRLLQRPSRSEAALGLMDERELQPLAGDGRWRPDGFGCSVQDDWRSLSCRLHARLIGITPP